MREKCRAMYEEEEGRLWESCKEFKCNNYLLLRVHYEVYGEVANLPSFEGVEGKLNCMKGLPSLFEDSLGVI